MKLDLHGKSHYEISQIIDLFIWDAIKSNKFEIDIITGKSKRMQDLTLNIIKEYKLEYSIGDYWNSGYIKVYIT